MDRTPLVALLAIALLACSGGEPPESVRSAVVVLLDTLRADRVSAYGYERPTTPHLDSLAAEGVLFETAISNSSWTLPAVAGLLSGQFLTARVFDRTLRASLVESIHAAGIETAAFTEGGNFSSAYALDRGFATYQEEEGAVRRWIQGGWHHETADGGIEYTFESARQWLRDHAGERFFLLVHTYETHAPYKRKHFASQLRLDPGTIGDVFEMEDAVQAKRGELAIGAVELRYLSALYDGGVRVADQHVGALLETLREIGRANDTLVVVMSDHGEELGERLASYAGSHGHTLYDELIRVPLIVKVPGRSFSGRRVDSQVRTIDVMPTVLDLLGVAHADVDGRSLVPIMEGREREHRPARVKLVPGPRIPSRVGVRTGQYKLILNPPGSVPKRPRIELYHLGRDPQERTNLAVRHTAQVRKLRGQLFSLLEPVRAEGDADFREPEDLPDAQRERLKALGYVE